ncbi:MAG: glycoside hydrolase family 13 protein [Edaphocola sp.]
MYLKYLLFCLFGFIGAYRTSAQIIDRVEPANWWVGMANTELQILVYGKNIGKTQVATGYPGVEVKGVARVANPNYLFVNVDIAKAKPGNMALVFSENGKVLAQYHYPLLQRANTEGRNMGVTSGDVIYLLMPDRFANGNTDNDRVKGMADQSLNRKDMWSRHGGDVRGVANHLDYFTSLGVTAIWMTPEVENDMTATSYHGYAATDLYKIDSRVGSNEEYAKYVEAAHGKGLKVIKDIAPNHVGTQHWFIKDLPDPAWVHQWPVYTNTNNRHEAVMDPHAAAADRKQMLDGWFVASMPDLNEENPLVATYLTQNYIWWLEYAGIDGLRIDTYPYNDPQFMANCLQRIKTEFPQVGIFGETLEYTPVAQAFFTEGNTLDKQYRSLLPGVTDAFLKDAVYEAINGKNTWFDGVNRLYNALSQDVLYKNPSRNVLFLDNHDMDRFFSVVNEKTENYKIGMALLLTLRGIPQLYYGTEILMKNKSNPDGKVREDFPGGWQGDSVNVFTSKNLSVTQTEAWNYLAGLLAFRKKSAALQRGELMQYVPENNVYVYFRYTDEETVMVAYNAADSSQKLPTKRFAERLSGFRSAYDVVAKNTFALTDTLTLPTRSVRLLQLK